MKVEVFERPKQIAEYLSVLIRKLTDKSDISISLSGGSTPEKIYSHLADIQPPLSWNKINLYWGDERMVPPDDPESNFLMVKNSLFNKIIIPKNNIHRIKGENDPKSEIGRYSEIINESNNGRLDLILLGLGTDGHTASIFPGTNLFDSNKTCVISEHPQSKQIRISITGKVINSGTLIVFMVTGKSKSGIISDIINKRGDWKAYPASMVNPENGKLIWLLDNKAASQL